MNFCSSIGSLIDIVIDGFAWLGWVGLVSVLRFLSFVLDFVCSRVSVANLKCKSKGKICFLIVQEKRRILSQIKLRADLSAKIC